MVGIFHISLSINTYIGNCQSCFILTINIFIKILNFPSLPKIQPKIQSNADARQLFRISTWQPFFNFLAPPPLHSDLLLGRHEVVVEAELALLLGEEAQVRHRLLHRRQVGARAHRLVLRERKGGCAKRTVFSCGEAVRSMFRQCCLVLLLGHFSDCASVCVGGCVIFLCNHCYY